MTYEPPAGILICPPGMAHTKEGETIEHFLPGEFTDVEELSKSRLAPGLIPLGIVRSADPTSHYTFKQFDRVWIAPEITRRVQAGVPLESIRPLRQVLIVFPPRSAVDRHRVLLNEEVQVRAAVRPSYRSSFSNAGIGDQMELRLRDMFDLRVVEFEGVNMVTDGFAWLRPEAEGWTLYFNFLPNSGLFKKEDAIAVRDSLMRQVQDAMAQEMLRGFAQNVFTDDSAIRDAMAMDGWCPTPILLPEPWQQMCEAYRSADAAGAARLARSAIGPDELDTMLTSWISDEPFASDRGFLTTGIERYKAGDCVSAVSVLLPRIEGIANRVREKRGIGSTDRLSDVFAKLDQLASADVRDGYLATRIREEFAALITGFLLLKFRPSAPGAGATRGRHAHAHGATSEVLYDQEYALKVILSLDALYFVSR